MITIACDEPQKERTSVSIATCSVSGWAIARDQPIAKVTLFLDGKTLGEAAYGLPRPDVYQTYPNVTGSAASGYWYELDVRTLPDGLHVLRIEAVTKTGEKASITKELMIGKPEESHPVGCPICQQPNAVPRKDWHGENGSFQLYHCFNCDTGFIHPLPTAAELQQYYAKVYWEIAPDLIRRSPIHGDTDFIDRLIRAQAPAVRSVFEIGCGFGNLLNGLRFKGYSVSGLEYSPAAAELGKSHLGIDITVGSPADAEANAADCVILRHMLEHSPRPALDFALAANCVTASGILIFISPNYGSLAAQLLGRFWEWFAPPSHLFYFTLGSMRHLARRNDLQIVHLQTRRGDAALFADAWNRASSYLSVVNDSWEGEWLRNRARAYQTLLSTEGEVLIDRMGLSEELIVVFKKAAPESQTPADLSGSPVPGKH